MLQKFKSTARKKCWLSLDGSGALKNGLESRIYLQYYNTRLSDIVRAFSSFHLVTSDSGLEEEWMDGGKRWLEDEAITSTVTWPDLWVYERTGLMRAYQQLETCSAPDGDLGLQPFLPVCLSVCPHASMQP